MEHMIDLETATVSEICDYVDYLDAHASGDDAARQYRAIVDELLARVGSDD